MSETPMQLRTSGGRVLGDRVERATNPLRRMRGLLGRASLPDGGGLWIEPAPAVHTWGMRFAIDVVFLDRTHRVVHIAERVEPWKVAGARGARVALELPAGTVARVRVALGDEIHIARPPVLADPDEDPNG